MSLEKNLHQYGTKLLLGGATIGLAVCFCTIHSLNAADQPGDTRVVEAKATTGTSSQLALRPLTPGTTTYETRRGDTVISVARHYLPQTSYLTSSELAEAIRGTNANLKGTFLKPGQQLTIPGILDSPVVERAIPVPKDFEVRAIYLTGIMAGSDRGLSIARRWRTAGGNAVVFDIKDSDGQVTIPFEHPLIGPHKIYIHDLPKYTRFLHSQGLHAIARIAMFRDERLVVSHPELAVKSKKSGQPWRENGKLVWTDPSRIEVQEYDIALAQTAARAGADEIQFDYVRCPDARGVVFSKPNTRPGRVSAITGFLDEARKALTPYNVFLSADIFGYVSWNIDDTHIGQQIEEFGSRVDYMCLMLYPSGFQFGIPGYRNPVNHPYEIVSLSLRSAAKRTGLPPVRFRPWLQAFRDYAFGHKQFGGKEIRSQIDAADKFGSDGWMLWNPRNVYSEAGLKK